MATWNSSLYFDYFYICSFLCFERVRSTSSKNITIPLVEIVKVEKVCLFCF